MATLIYKIQWTQVVQGCPEAGRPDHDVDRFLSARVTLEDTTARVEHDDATAPADLQAAVEKAGYTPSLQTA